jgi:hypothetical protein
MAMRRSLRGSWYFSVLLVLLFSSVASAQTLTGAVKNATTGKPAAGDDVILLKLGEGMEEEGRTRTDVKGNFSFKLDDAQSPHLVRVVHQEVTYHRMAPPGTTSVEVEVYDVAKKLDEGINVVADIMRLQVEQGQLEVVRMFAVDNTSKPPRTQMNEHNLEFYVPEGAQILGGQAVTQGGQPINSAPVPEGGTKTKYAFIFPLRPGTTQFQAAYQLPYTGSANIDPKSPYKMQHFVAILPKSMQFTEASATAGFKSMNDPNQPDASVEVASDTALGQDLAFKVSGEGTLAERQEGNGTQGESASADNGNRPGGGLGPPIDAPDPLQKYRWYILGGCAAALVVGGVFVASRQQAAARAAAQAVSTSEGRIDSGEPLFVEADYQENDSQFADSPPARPARAAQPPASRSAMLLEGLKEELFQLEVDHKQGKISQQEYEKAKAALDLTLDRALKRQG